MYICTRDKGQGGEINWTAYHIIYIHVLTYLTAHLSLPFHREFCVIFSLGYRNYNDAKLFNYKGECNTPF